MKELTLLMDMHRNMISTQERNRWSLQSLRILISPTPSLLRMPKLDLRNLQHKRDRAARLLKRAQAW